MSHRIVGRSVIVDVRESARERNMGCCRRCNCFCKAVRYICPCLRTRAPRTQEMEVVDAAGSEDLTPAMEIGTTVFDYTSPADVEMVQVDASHSGTPAHSVSTPITELNEVDKGTQGESATLLPSNVGSCEEMSSVLVSSKEHISTLLLDDIPMLSDLKVSTPALPSVTGGRAVSGSESEQQSSIQAKPQLDGSDVFGLKEQTDERSPLSSTDEDGDHTTNIPDVSSVAIFQKEEENGRGSSPLTDKTGESTGAVQHEMEYEGWHSLHHLHVLPLPTHAMHTIIQKCSGLAKHHLSLCPPLMHCVVCSGPQSAPGDAVGMEVQTSAAQDMECQEEGQGEGQDSGKQQQDKASSQEKWPDTAHDQRGTC